MSIFWMSYAWQEGPMDSNERYVYLALADNANQEGLAFPSLTTIAAKTRLSESTVRRAIKSLEKGGWLTVLRGLGAGNYSRYQLKKVSQGNLSSGQEKGVSVEEKGVRLKNPPHPLLGVTVKNHHSTSRLRRGQSKPPNPGAENQKQIDETDAKAKYDSMSPAYRAANPWSSEVIA